MSTSLRAALRRMRSTAHDAILGPEPAWIFVRGGIAGRADDGGRGTHLVPPTWIDDEERVTVGDGVVVMEGGTLRTHGTGTVVLGGGVRFGRFAAIDARASVVIGQDVSGSDFVAVTDSWGPGPSPELIEPVVIGDGSYLGHSCIVGPGARVGRNVFVGEGAVVLGDVPDHSVVHGNPARVVRRLEAGTDGGARWT